MWTTKAEERFIQFDPGSTNLSEVLRKLINEELRYQIQKVPVEDHYAQGTVENRIGYNTNKINSNLMDGPRKLPNLFWELANRHVDHMSNFCFHTALQMTPHELVGGLPIDTRWFQPFGIGCWVKHSRGHKGNKIGKTKAYRAYFVGFVDTERLEPNYYVVPYSRNIQTNRIIYGKIRSTKSVVFDSVDSIGVSPDTTVQLEEPINPFGELEEEHDEYDSDEDVFYEIDTNPRDVYDSAVDGLIEVVEDTGESTWPPYTPCRFSGETPAPQSSVHGPNCVAPVQHPSAWP